MAISVFTDKNKDALIDDQSSTDSTQNAQKIPDVEMLFPIHPSLLSQLMLVLLEISTVG